jgi:hypothetical protein
VERVKAVGGGDCACQYPRLTVAQVTIAVVPPTSNSEVSH